MGSNNIGGYHVRGIIGKPKWIFAFGILWSLGASVCVADTTVSGTRSIIGTGDQRSIIGTGDQRSIIGTGDQRSIIGTGDQRSTIGTGDQRSIIGTGAARSVSSDEPDTVLLGGLEGVSNGHIDVMGQEFDVSGLALDEQALQLQVGRLVYVE